MPHETFPEVRDLNDALHQLRNDELGDQHGSAGRGDRKFADPTGNTATSNAQRRLRRTEHWKRRISSLALDIRREAQDGKPLDLRRACSGCGRRLATNDAYCRNCGTPTRDGAQAS